MRIATLLLGLVALASLAPAAPAPLLCDAECTIQASAAGYVLPVVVVTSGAVVTWASTDSTHVNRDGLPPAGPVGTCIQSDSFHPLTGTVSEKLEIVDGVLYATKQGEPIPTPIACTGATKLPDGSFLLHYYCVLHPTMRGALVVTE
jgi:hypothetical protein